MQLLQNQQPCFIDVYGKLIQEKFPAYQFHVERAEAPNFADPSYQVLVESVIEATQYDFPDKEGLHHVLNPPPLKFRNVSGAFLFFCWQTEVLFLLWKIQGVMMSETHRGGKREGAGRKPTGTEYVRVRLTPAQRAKLMSVGGSALLQQLIDAMPNFSTPADAVRYRKALLAAQQDLTNSF